MVMDDVAPSMAHGAPTPVSSRIPLAVGQPTAAESNDVGDPKLVAELYLEAARLAHRLKDVATQ